MIRILMIGAFGAAGAICRHLAGLVCVRLWGPHFGFGTLVVNVLGCFALGLLMRLFEADAIRISEQTHAGVTIGFLGALTTFSTFGYQTIRHVEEGDWNLALVNVLANLLLGLAAAGCGLALGRMIAA